MTRIADSSNIEACIHWRTLEQYKVNSIYIRDGRDGIGVWYTYICTITRQIYKVLNLVITQYD